MKLVVISLLFALVSAQCPKHDASERDQSLAQMVQQSGRVGDVTGLGIASKINTHLENSGATMKDCQQFNLSELNDLIRTFWCHMSPDLHKVYTSRPTDKRQLRFDSLEAYEASWVQESAGDHQEVLLEAKCAEVLMMWTHHVTQDSKSELQQLLKLPSLPTYNPKHVEHPTHGKYYADALTCVTGHNMTATSTSDHVLPHWPAEVHYTGMGHGAYPFWLGGSGEGGQAAIEVWWSETKRSEKFYHSSCGMKEAGASKDGPCYHLFVGAQPDPKAYLYTAKEDFCCISGPGSTVTRRGGASPLPADDDEGGGGAQLLAPPQSDFMDTMTIDPSFTEINGTYYSGPAIKWVLKLPSSQPVTYFWYVTTKDNRPVQQGEGGNGGAGIEIFHEYNTSSFGPATLDTSIFDVPEICKTTTSKCTFP